MECPEENELVDFMRGDLDEASRDAIETHLDGCDLCREVVVELARFEPASSELAITEKSHAPEPIAAEPTAAEPTADPAKETYKVAPRLGEGDKVGRYVVLGKVGEGGMGVVYAAYDPELDRKVAIKLLMTSLGGSLDAELAEQRTRLLREAQAMAKLTHPNVITVHDVGEFGDQVFVAMEFIDGCTLTEWLKEHSGWRERLDILLAAGRGLAAAHKVGLVHRDFKPDNVLIDREGRAVVTDFGLARPAAGKTDSFSSVRVMESTPVISAQLTRTGALVGTPAYMAPEQLAGERSDEMADQFSFCVTVYEGLFGARPFEGRVLAELMANVSSGRIRALPRDIDVPRRIRRAILRGLAVDPENRFPSMEELLAELSYDPSRKWRRWAIVLLPSSVLAVGLLAYQQSDSPDDRFCSDLEAHLRGIWDDERRASLEKVFLGTGRPFAPTTWKFTEAALDAHVAQWRDAQEHACEQAADGVVAPSILALRMQCLETQRRQIGTLVSVLQNIDSEGLKRARDAVDTLADPERCDDIDMLARQDAALDTPAKQKLRRELSDINNRAFALQRTGQLEASIETATEALELAREADETWSEAEALITMAENREFQGRYEEAEELQHAAMTAAIASGNDPVIVRVSVGRVWAGQDPGSDLHEAERWYQHGQAALERAGARSVHRNQLENGMAAAYMAHQHYDEAKDHAEKALAVHDSEDPSSAVGLDSTWGTLGQLYTVEGRLDEAEDAFERSLEITKERYGPTHPFVASGLENLGALYGNRYDYERSQQTLLQALAVRRVALGDDHPDNANTLINLANSDRHLGDFAAARTKLEEAHALIRKTQAGSTNEADILRRLGNVQRDLGDLDAAKATYRTALELVEDKEGLPASLRVEYFTGMGRVHQAEGDLDEARRWYEQAMELVADEPREIPRVALAWVLWATTFPDGVPEDQRAEVDRSALYTTQVPSPLRAADAQLRWADVNWASGERAAAYQHVDAARALLEPLGRERLRPMEEVLAWEREHPRP